MTIALGQPMTAPPMMTLLGPHKRPRWSQQTFHAGDRVDAMDLESVWHEGRVREVDPVQGYRVHFLGWSGRWDEWIELTSERIQPAYTKLPNWRRALKVGDPVEVRSSVHTDRWLSGVVVAVAHEEERVMCEYSHDSRWIDLTSEEICLPNTHFSRELDSLSPQKMEQIHRECEIHREVRAANLEAVRRIVAQDPAMVHLKGPLERTPLLVAADCCHLDMIRLLLEHGASLADMDRSNANCLHLAVRGQRERCAAVVEELARRGADVNGRDSRLSTPLHLVAMRGYLDVGLSLIRHGADVNAKDMSQVTPLRHAAYRGEDAIVRLLLHHGADPSMVDAAGGRPVEVACFLRNKARRPGIEALLGEGHRGHLCKKMRQMVMWEADEDARERQCTILRRRREAGLLPPPTVTFTHNITTNTNATPAAAAAAPALGAAAAAVSMVMTTPSSSGGSNPAEEEEEGPVVGMEVVEEEAPSSLVPVVLQYVVQHMNRDLFTEMVDLLV